MYSIPSQPRPAAGSQARPQGLSRGIMIFSVVLALLLMSSGLGIIYYAAVAHPAQLGAQATATIQTRLTSDKNATATAMAQANHQATTTAQVSANATATTRTQTQATATALQNVYTQATSGTPVLNLSLATQTTANWEVGDATDGSNCHFIGGALHTTIIPQHYSFPCLAQATNFANFALEIQMTIVRGDAGGVIFRCNDVASHCYTFGVKSDGTYDLSVIKDATHITSIALDQSTLINANLGQANILTIIAQGGTFYLYINKQFVTSASDTSYSAGAIGVYSENVTNPTEVAFSNLRVWQL
ncbi:MAG TPA: family 16 glycoside hydrolase [Ktedonosporobacter sp.]|nr:family 16 glycoside hydrolase [Ktedonosporobacter sp.]